MTYRNTATIAAALLCLLALVALWPRSTTDERALSRDLAAKLSSLPIGQTLALSALPTLHDADQVCLIDSYAIRAGDRQEDSLHRIFGDIDYASFRNEIVTRYTGEERPGLYLVKQGVVTKSLRLVLPPRTYLKPAELEQPAAHRYYTLSSCHIPTDVCLRRDHDDAHGEHPIVVNLCSNSEGNLKND